MNRCGYLLKPAESPGAKSQQSDVTAPCAARLPVNICENSKNCVNTVLLLWGKAELVPLRRMTDVKLGKGKSRRSFCCLAVGVCENKLCFLFPAAR